MQFFGKTSYPEACLIYSGLNLECKIMSGNGDVMNQSVSWSCYRRGHSYLFLYLYSMKPVIVLTKDVDNCACIIACLDCHECNSSCLISLAPYPRKWIISFPAFSQGGLCEHFYLAPTYLPRFLPSLPLSILPSFLFLHTLSLRLIYNWTFDMICQRKKTKQALSSSHGFRTYWSAHFSFQSIVFFKTTGLIIHHSECLAQILSELLSNCTLVDYAAAPASIHSHTSIKFHFI